MRNAIEWNHLKYSFLPKTASVLLKNMLVCFSGDMVFVEELDRDEVPDTNVFSLSVSDASFLLAVWGVGGLDTEYTKSSLSSSSLTEHESLLREWATESGVPASDCSFLKKENKLQS